MIGATPFYLAAKTTEHAAAAGSDSRSREQLRRPERRVPHLEVRRRRRRLRLALG